MDRPDAAPQLDDLFTDLVRAFEIAVFEHRSGADFHLLGHPPAWLSQLFPTTAQDGILSVDGRAPVLQNFLADAAQAWQDPTAGLIRSGFWAEASETGDSWQVEAMAVRCANRRILLLQRCAATYDQQVTLLQAARDRVLQQHEEARHHRKSQQALTTKLVDSERARDDVMTILQQLNLATLLIDGAGEIRFVSAAATRLLRLPAAAFPRPGRSWQRLLPVTKSDRLALQNMLHRHSEQRERLCCHLDTSTGQRIWLEFEIHDDPRDAQSRIIFLHDVTDLHHLRRLLDQKAHYYDLIGKSRCMTRVYEQIHDLAQVDTTVLIDGETGTGKELVARALHQASPRQKGPFIAANCAGLTDSLLGSQLFGHKRGAFTGAITAHQGFFEAAHGGVVFLDEIGDIPPNVQTSLLRVLQEKEITRLGDSRPRQVNVRIVAATHHDLGRDVANGAFRADLLYRIRVARIHLPALRERKEDIPLLVASFLSEGRASMGKAVSELTPTALAALMEYHWPGNVRELKSAIDYAIIHCKDETIDSDDLPPELLDTPSPLSSRLISFTPTGDERSRLTTALERARGNRTQAARLLGISRATLYRRLTDLGLLNN
ncbi:MAG: sigma 54-interacting transcriptional regulator [Nitrospirales bacterium]|nr:sigma 54-interacting transcriptional regulator [Nitrospirales bacterium]